VPSRLATFALSLLLLAAVSPSLEAQDLPDRPIRIVIAFPAGGPTDFVGRLVADKVKDILGRPFIIENKAGANGALGADYVAKSEPDGTTLFLTTLGAVGVTPHMRSDVPTIRSGTFAAGHQRGAEHHLDRRCEKNRPSRR
jgi:tripartite-type tricarboxylate transporter receptor subunit TctC